MLRGVLTEKEIYDYIVAAKWKETLFPNLPLQYGVASIDGYDGGMLPLQDYVALKQAFPLREKQAADGRLREELEAIPNVDLLSQLNVKYVLMDRIRDAWVDGAYYDLALSQKISPEEQTFMLEVQRPFEATSIGIISHLSGGSELRTGETVAWIDVIDGEGVTYTFPFRAGLETAEGRYAEASRASGVAHAEAHKAKAWKGNPDSWDYLGKLSLPSAVYPKVIQIRFAADTGAFMLRGLSLLDERTNAEAPVVLSPSLQMDFLGDVKIYRNNDAWPRAFVTQSLEFNERNKVRIDHSDTRIIRIELSDKPADHPLLVERSADTALIVDYQPERVDIEVNLARDGFLILTDSYYPGWKVTVDGVEKPILRANGAFRAVELTDGRHLVRFAFDPPSFKLGMAVSIAGGLSVLGLLILGNSRSRPRLRGQ
jgi:hypothetical protein